MSNKKKKLVLKNESVSFVKVAEGIKGFPDIPPGYYTGKINKEINKQKETPNYYQRKVGFI